jgi:hypothetical protein
VLLPDSGNLVDPQIQLPASVSSDGANAAARADNGHTNGYKNQVVGSSALNWYFANLGSGDSNDLLGQDIQTALSGPGHPRKHPRRVS